ncbi:MAG: carboxypeptidase-like regulatory domain-containing protein, partial [Sphingobacteriales bacterium]
MMRFLFSFCLFLMCFANFSAKAAIVRGTVSDSLGNPVPYASVYVKDRSYGVSADAEGSYFLELPAGNFTLNFSAMNFFKLEKNISLAPAQTLTLNITLRESVVSLNDIVISKVYVDRGREIMRLVRKKADVYNEAVENYKCNTYQKISVEKIDTKPDSLDNKPSEKEQIRKKNKALKDSLKIQDSTSVRKKKKQKEPTVAQRGARLLGKLDNMNLIESVEETNYRRPGKYKVVVNAYHDFSEVKTRSANGSVYLGFEYGERDIAAVGQEYEDPYLIYFKPSETDFNFYRNLIDAPKLCEKPLISPLSATAELNYRFSLDTSFYDNGKLIYKIQVKPIFKAEPLFSGVIFVEDSTWVIQSVDLAVNPAALLICREFHINQDYKEVQPGKFLPVRREFTYTIKDGNTIHKGNTRVDHSDYKVNTTFPVRFFNNEVKSYDIQAFNRDTTWWDSLRPITLKTTELAYIEKADSIKTYLESETYLDSVDAEYNHLDVWNFLLSGIGHRNRFNKTEYFISPLIQQLNPAGIGGYRHMLFATFNKEFKNDYLLETRGQIDYGFKN